LPMVPQIAAGGHGYWSSSWDGSGAVCDSRLEPSGFACKKPAICIVTRPASEGSNCAVVQFTSQPPRLVALAALLPGSPRCHPDSGNCPCDVDPTPYSSVPTPRSGIFHRRDEQDYTLTLTDPADMRSTTWTLVTLRSQVDEQLQMCLDQQPLTVCGELNHAGKWLWLNKLTARATGNPTAAQWQFANPKDQTIAMPTPVARLRSHLSMYLKY